MQWIRPAVLVVSALGLLGLSGCAGTGSDLGANSASPDWARGIPAEPVALAVFKSKREMVVLRDGVPLAASPEVSPPCSGSVLPFS